MRLAFYRGTSLVSKLIRWQTRGQYSHVALLLDDGSVIEAWHVGGVLHNANPGVRHTPGTVIDIYDVKGMTAEVQQRAEQWLKRQLGKRYDFGSVFRFLSRDEKDWSACEWFCSELVMEALMHGGIKLLNIESHKVSPEVLSWSPLLKLSNTVVTD